MSLEIKKRIGNFKEIRFRSKSQFLVADLKQSYPQIVEVQTTASCLLQLHN